VVTLAALLVYRGDRNLDVTRTGRRARPAAHIGDDLPRGGIVQAVKAAGVIEPTLQERNRVQSEGLAQLFEERDQGAVAPEHASCNCCQGGRFGAGSGGLARTLAAVSTTTLTATAWRRTRQAQ
jgi:hypothetical protein